MRTLLSWPFRVNSENTQEIPEEWGYSEEMSPNSSIKDGNL